MTPVRMDGTPGYVRLYRRITENPVWTALEPCVFKVMIAFLLRANWKPKTWYDGRRQVDIPRGSFVTSYPKMAEFCQLSAKQVRSSFLHLEKLEFAAYTRAGRWTMVTILNYETYQPKADNEGTVEGSLRAGSGRDEGRMRATTKEVKKVRSKEYSPLAPKDEGQLFAPFSSANIPDESPTELDLVLDRVSQSIHARHPGGRRDCSATIVRKKLATILKYQGIARADQIAYVERIDRNHASMCATEGWMKNGGEFAKGLENWLAPTMERYTATCCALQPPQPERARMVL